MKTFALAATVAAGLALTANTADAQFRTRGGSSYSTPSYGYGYRNTAPAYSYPSAGYYSPTYSGGVVTSGYTPYYGSGAVVPATGYSSYYAPTYSTPMYSGYGTTPYYGNSSYGGYGRGTYLSPSGGAVRGMGWRW